MTEMSRTLVIRLSTAPALLSIINYSHTRIKESSDLWLVSFVSTSICNLYNRTLFNLIRTEYTKLNTNNRLDF